ncbi:MAG: hypothetical protein FJ008_01585 [Chloroflexi bacterium]|nr:hypothetical protein [Chloroflexota bacterium]MBM3154005.1 hypothetical protein [Chloroflexota bacterium]MBM3172767.1 hypothetical protein [Chloroflexota bacterium]MBM3174907.1 hypothetical protein [Chloroflexota bacterium]MBM4449686.1 hypothetical protein [Chloroflexota bacterium]
MSPKLCNLFEPCESPEAPICPLLQESVAHGIWYGNEPICRSKKFQNLSWVKKQRKIASLKLAEDDGYFTVRMLNSLHQAAITKRLVGANPNITDPEAEWLSKFGQKQAMTTSERVALRAARPTPTPTTLPLFD